MASGLIPLAFDYAAPKQLIKQGVNGFLADYDNEASFLEQIECVLNQQANWQQIKLSARETTEALSWRDIVSEFAKELAIAFEENLNCTSSK